METYLLKFSNYIEETMEFHINQESLEDAIRVGESNPLFQLESVHSVDEDMEEHVLLWHKSLKITLTFE